MSYLLIFILSLITSIFSSLPLLHFKTSGIFYALDPDVTYLGNILSYIEHHKIFFFGHPGTPTIILLSYLLAPLRIIHSDFNSWAFAHLDLIYLYVRLAQSVLLGIAMSIFLVSVYKAIHHRLILLFSWASVLCFSFLPYLGSSILPETTSFLLISTWLLIFSYFNKTRSLVSVLLLSFLSGVATGNKLINVFLILSSVLLSFMSTVHFHKQKIKNLLLSITCSFIGFLWSTWTVRSSYLSLFTWGTKLFVSSQIHAQGRSTFVDPKLFIQSIQSFASTNTLPLILIAVFTVYVVSMVLTKRKLLSDPTTIVSVVTLVTIFIIFKYTLSYYQLMPYIVVIYLIGTNLTNRKSFILMTISVIIIKGTVPSVNNYLKVTTRSITEAINLTDFVAKYSSSSTTVWEWGTSRQFAILWAQPYGQAFPPRMIANISPPFYQITDNFKKLTQDGITKQEVFSICWQHLYLQQSSLSTFFNQFPDRLFTTVLIPGTNPPMVLAKSNHCS